MPFFGVPIRNGLPIGLGSVAGFGVQQFDPSLLFEGGTVPGTWYDPSDLTTMFTTSAGTTPVAMPGGGAAVSVGRMLDKSGNGNHAIAINDSTARPELRARVNLLTYSEEFQNAAWARVGIAAFGSGSVANTTATTDPLGGNTADFLLPTGGIANRQRVSQTATVASGSQTLQSFYIKPFGYTKVALRENNTSGYYVSFDLASTSSPSILASSNATGTVVHIGNGWFLCTMTTSIVGTSFGAGVYVLSPTYTTGDPETPTWTPNGTDGIFVWGADLRPANIGAAVPAYQRIADANTYDTAGFPLYLRFDGIDDGLYTPANLNLTATDKVGVFAGVRKLGTALSMVTEFNNNVTNGTFYVLGNNLTSTDYGFSLRGTTQAVYLPTGYAAPISNILAVSYDIAGVGIANENVPRINGIVKQDNPSGSDAGTGNFGTYPLNIGVRSATSSPAFFFNGHLHGLIVVGSAVSAGNISATESWMAGKTGLVLP